MKIEYKQIEELIPYIHNPRKNDHAVEAVANSIAQFGFKSPIVIDKHNEIVNGHTRLKAAMQLGIPEVPCVIADDLTDEQIRAFRLVDNKVAELAEWDVELLHAELAALNMDMEQFGFEEQIERIEKELQDNPYTNKIQTPIYEITGDKPALTDLYDTSKRDLLVNKIQQSDIPKDIEEFLMYAACRHVRFNYRNIAEYYAHANSDIQELMEDSALVIIDFEKAIELGYVRLSNSIDYLSLNGDEDEA